MHPSWMDVHPLQQSESSTATDFDRIDLPGKFTGRSVGTGGSVGTGTDTYPSGRETGTSTGRILGWGIGKGIDTGTAGIVKHFQDQATGTDTDTGISSSNIDRATGTANLSGLLFSKSESESVGLHPIAESESESSLTGMSFRPKTFDDNLVNHYCCHVHHLDHHLTKL